MDGTLTKMQPGDWHPYSEVSWKALMSLYYTGMLTYQEMSSLQQETTKQGGTSKVHHSPS